MGDASEEVEGDVSRLVEPWSTWSSSESFVEVCGAVVDLVLRLVEPWYIWSSSESFAETRGAVVDSVEQLVVRRDLRSRGRHGRAASRTSRLSEPWSPRSSSESFFGAAARDLFWDGVF